MSGLAALMPLVRFSPEVAIPRLLGLLLVVVVEVAKGLRKATETADVGPVGPSTPIKTHKQMEPLHHLG
jgi:hypothetical protein